MSNEIARISDKTLIPLLQPKRHELISLIGEQQLIRETSFALQAVNSNSQLMKADPVTVAKVIYNTAITGLSLNPVLKLAYVTPRFVGGQIEAILMPSYQGLTKLITDTGSVTKVYAYPVFEGDEYSSTFGTSVEITHKRKHKSNNIICAYAVGVLPDGTMQVEEMSAEEINAIRARSDSYRAFKEGKVKSAIWETDYSEMCRKTVIKRLTKYLPKSNNSKAWEKLANAIDMDNADYPASDAQYTLIENLTDNSTFSEGQKEDIMRRVSAGLTNGEAKNIITDLQANQVRPIDRGNMSASETTQAVNTSVNADNT